MSWESDIEREQALVDMDQYLEEPEANQGAALLHHSQLLFFLCTALITVAVAGIRGGKTHAGAFKTLLYAISHPCGPDEMHLVCSPTYQMSKVPVEKIFKLLYDKAIFPICPLIRFIRSERVFILAAADGGVTRIKVLSLHDPNKARGIKALSAWIDEGAYITKEAWDVIQGRLADSNGPVWITTTPAGYNFIYELYEKAVKERDEGIPLDEREVRFIHWRSVQNTFVKQEGFARLSENFDARTVAQEMDAKFIKMAGLVYHAFSKARNVQSAPINNKLPLWVGQDFNVTMMASSFSQPYRNRAGALGNAIVHERLAPDSGTEALCVYLEEFCTKHRFKKDQVTIFPDASGKARSTTGKSDHELLKAAGFRVKTLRRNPLVKDRINCMNGLLLPRNGVPRKIIDPSCVQHIRSYSKQIYKPDSDPPEPDKEHGLDHIMDADGYTSWINFPLRPHASLGNKRAA